MSEELTEEQIWDLSDEELAELANQERAEMNSPDTEYEEANSSEEPDDLEQPDDQDSTDDQEEDLDNSDEFEEDEGTAPEDDEEEEDPSSEESDGHTGSEESEEASQNSSVEDGKPKTYRYKANGKEFEFTEDEIVAQFGKVFGQAMNYTQKMQAIAPYRKMISAIEEEGIKEEDLNLAIDALKGNKDAVANLIKRANVDVLDLDLESESNYVPNSYGRDEHELQVKDVIDQISADPEFEITQHVVAEQWDDASREVFSANPELIKELHTDVVNGVFDKVSPIAMKMKVMDGARKSDIEYYIEAGKQYHMQTRSEELNRFAQQRAQSRNAQTQRARVDEVEKRQQQQTRLKQMSKKRKAAAPTASRSGQKGAIDYLDDSDEAFEEWYRKLQESM